MIRRALWAPYDIAAALFHGALAAAFNPGRLAAEERAARYLA